MLLSDLRRDLKDVIRHGGDPDITGINFDSRAVRPGDLFVAVSGSDRDGHEFAAAAVGGGAVALLVER
ncbi:MAG TPA: Mur ligase domain-containing protein, partial [Chloroflexota bacterium]|nr:Mur ligase domain-containing protein [Chloroflexota bacterium]